MSTFHSLPCVYSDRSAKTEEFPGLNQIYAHKCFLPAPEVPNGLQPNLLNGIVAVFWSTHRVLDQCVLRE